MGNLKTIYNNNSDNFITFNGIPGWIAHITQAKTRSDSKVIIYNIFSKEPFEGAGHIKEFGDDMYFYAGTLSYEGKLVSMILGKTKMPFFGKNIERAVRYLFLKTQDVK